MSTDELIDFYRHKIQTDPQFSQVGLLEVIILFQQVLCLQPSINIQERTVQMRRVRDGIRLRGFPCNSIKYGMIRRVHKFSCVHTESSDDSASFRCWFVLSFDNIQWCNTLWVCLWVNITAYNVLISPGTVSTDGVSFVTVTVHGVGGQDGKQTDTHEKEVLFWDGFVCLVPLMAVSVPVMTKTRCTLECTTFAVKTGNLRDIAERKIKKRGKRKGRFTWWGPRCPPAWRPAPHAAHLSTAAIAPTPHLDLCESKENHQKMPIFSIITLAFWHCLIGFDMIFAGFIKYWQWCLLHMCVYWLWIWECKSFVMTCSCPRLISLMSPPLRFLFIKPSLMWGRWGSCIWKDKRTGNQQKEKQHTHTHTQTLTNLLFRTCKSLI